MTCAYNHTRKNMWTPVVRVISSPLSVVSTVLLVYTFICSRAVQHSNWGASVRLCNCYLLAVASMCHTWYSDYSNSRTYSRYVNATETAVQILVTWRSYYWFVMFLAKVIVDFVRSKSTWTDLVILLKVQVHYILTSLIACLHYSVNAPTLSLGKWKRLANNVHKRVKVGTK